MKEQITFRIAGERALEAIGSLQAKPLGDGIFEVMLPLRHPETQRLFGAPARLGTHGWFIAFRTIRRTYSEAELIASPRIHLNEIRVFPEPLREPECAYEFAPECPCSVPILQTSPLVLGSELKCKDDLVRLADGAWVCKPRFLEAMLEGDVDPLPSTPIFRSERALQAWAERPVPAASERIGRPLPGPLEGFRLTRSQLSDFPWVQIHPPVGPFSISPPTDSRHAPYRENHPSVLCPCDRVFGPGLVSELYLRQIEGSEGDWSLTQEFIGSSRGVFLPMRPLVVSQRCFRFLRQFRLHNVSYQCVHFVN